MNPTPPDATNEKLLKEFNSVVAETEQLLHSLATAGTGKAGALRASVEERLAAAGDRLAKIREDAIGQASAAAHATDRYAHDNPWRTAGYAAALAGIAGLVVGLLISRR